ncbi:hypothetical protein RFN28_28665 [Mesorhizobium sp. VK24D]|uniref:Lysozyme inhibitor LprI N-terminal domain-containing protein n=1 Tax=Mesorhizobium album TaxID=3072314 RepID=A0ABU4Y637_9HYPH|nr:hypothetical protein [Mesorhizobium sp. VK24D]MDX8482402.1 hypothetical protein [Mesorhizobium sp. VK24D]
MGFRDEVWKCRLDNCLTFGERTARLLLALFRIADAVVDEARRLDRSLANVSCDDCGFAPRITVPGRERAVAMPYRSARMVVFGRGGSGRNAARSLSFVPAALCLPCAFLAFAWLSFITGSAFAAAGPSFDCANASIEAEKAICASDELSQMDRQIAGLVAQMGDLITPEKRPFMQEVEQEEKKMWSLGCAHADDKPSCLRNSMQKHIVQLQADLRDDDILTMAASTMIPVTPAKSADVFRRYPGSALANSWLVYLATHVPEAGVSPREGDAAKARAIAIFQEQSPSILNMLDLPKRKAADVPFFLLRLALEQTHADPIFDCPHGFLFQREEGRALIAFGGLYGSSMDGHNPLCEDGPTFMELPAWQSLNDLLVAALPDETEAGSIRFAIYADWAADDVRAVNFPRQFDTPKHRRDKQRAIRLIRKQVPRVWDRSDLKNLLVAVEQGQSAAKKWLMQNRGLSAFEASRCAEGIMGSYLAARLEYIAARGQVEPRIDNPE